MIGLDKNYIKKILDEMYPDARCELTYRNDYEFLIAVMLSAQTTDKKVNEITKILFEKYEDIDKLRQANQADICNIIRPLGNHNKKASYILSIANSLYEKNQGVVPLDVEFLLSLPGVGSKTVNVVLAELFSIPAIAVDTHVYRISYRLGISSPDDSVITTNNKLMDFFDKEDWIKIHHQFIFLGRYTCFKRSPKCQSCLFKDKCKKQL